MTDDSGAEDVATSDSEHEVDDASPSGDLSDAGDDQDLLKEAAPALRKFAKQAKALPDNVKGKSELQALLSVAALTVADIQEQQETKRSPHKDLTEVRENIKTTAKLCAELQLLAVSPDQNGQNANNILKELNENQNAFNKFHLKSDKNEAHLTLRIEATEKILDEINTGRIVITAPLKDKVIVELGTQLLRLKELQLEINQHDTSVSAAKILGVKKLYADSACEIFRSLIKNVPDDVKKKERTVFDYHMNKLPYFIKEDKKDRKEAFDADANALLELFEARSKALERAIVTNSIPITKSQIRSSNPKKSELIRNIEKKYQKCFSEIDASNSELNHAWVAEIIHAFLDKYPAVDSRSGKQLLAAAKSYLLNERANWEAVTSEFLIPIEAPADGSSAIGTAKVKTITTPAGHVLNDSSITFGGRWKNIEKLSFDEYKKTNEAGEKITLGRNSHSTTEHLHAVNTSRTEVKVGEKTLFNGTRHATVSAYDLFPDGISRMGWTRQQKMARDLISSKMPSAASAYPGDPNSVPNLASATELDKKWAAAMKAIGTDSEPDDPKQVSEQGINIFIKKAMNDPEFCELLRRRVAVNRAREIFIATVSGNPKLLQRIAEGKPVDFNCFSMITPDPLRNFLAKLIPSKFRKFDELSMRREEVQAWKDLQEEIEFGNCQINGKTVQAKIHTFSIGVNELSLGLNNKVSRAFASGWNMVEDQNEQNIIELIGNPADCLKEAPIFGGQVSRRLTSLLDENSESSTTAARRVEINREITEIETLTRQIATMWQSREYRYAGGNPYKLISRMALLSDRLESGTAFSCKSGVDRTAQADLEIKLLAVQCEHRSHADSHVSVSTGIQKQSVVPPYTERTDFEKYQLLSFIYKDKSRTALQRYNTGFEGSKLTWEALPDSFIPEQEERAEIREEFLGLSGKRSS